MGKDFHIKARSLQFPCFFGTYQRKKTYTYFINPQEIKLTENGQISSSVYDKVFFFVPESQRNGNVRVLIWKASSPNFAKCEVKSFLKGALRWLNMKLTKRLVESQLHVDTTLEKFSKSFESHVLHKVSKTLFSKEAGSMVYSWLLAGRFFINKNCDTYKHHMIIKHITPY